jgi:Fic family protein
MSMLQKQFEESLLPPTGLEPLLATASYVMDFLCIHPFSDGNGRMARILTLQLLYRFGYEVGKFISLERIGRTPKRDSTNRSINPHRLA